VSQRTERIDQLLREEIGAIIVGDIADPRVGFATITSVETTPDLRHAKVWVSVIGQPSERDATMTALRHAVPFIRHELGRVLRLRRIPDLHLELDDTAERGTRILRLLSELESGETPEPGAPAAAESLPTPTPRLPHEGDLGDEPPSAALPVIPVVPRSRRRTTGRHPVSHRKTRR
jgi:ribosome-binding factor A